MRHTGMFRTALVALVTILLTSQLQAADIFVSPTGSGEKTGANWSNALNGSNDGWHIDVKTAITGAVAGGAEEINVFLADGDYTITNQITLSSISVPVKLSGGYVGTTDGSFERSEMATTLKRSTYNIRFIEAISLSALRIEGIMFSGGYIKAKNGAAKGGAVHLNSSAVVVANCVFSGNHVMNDSKSGQSGQNGFAGGGAIAIDGGMADILDCKFSNNYIAGQNKNNSSGGAVYARNATLMVADCVFNGNFMHVYRAFNYNFGGAIATYYGSVSIKGCSFINNYGIGSSDAASSGGALAIRNAEKFYMSDCDFSKCYIAQYSDGTQIFSAGIALFDDMLSSDGVMTSVVERCVFDSKSVPNTAVDDFGKNVATQSDIAVLGGRLFMTNCVISSTRGNHSYSSYSIRCCSGSYHWKYCGRGYDSKSNSTVYNSAPCSIELVNCTIADGKTYGAVAQTDDVEIMLKNCIIYGNGTASVVNPTSVEYCCLQEEHEGVGNFVADPQWTGYPYYHLLTKNANGAITNGWFSGTFESAKCAADSPCIDAGAPSSVGLDLEPDYSGRRVNIGAYGGTPWASKTSPLPGYKVIIR